MSVGVRVSVRKSKQIALSGIEVIICSGDRGSKPDNSLRVDWYLYFSQHDVKSQNNYYIPTQTSCSLIRLP
jgi:hypothetical protein